MGRSLGVFGGSLGPPAGLQIVSKMWSSTPSTPHVPQQGFRAPKRTPKGLPRGSQEGSKRAPRGLQNVIMITDVPVRLATTRTVSGDERRKR